MRKLNNKHVGCFLILMFCFSSCKHDQVKIITVRNFILEVPNSWNFYGKQGIDSKTYFLVSPREDSLIISTGPYAINIKENVLIFPEQERHNIDTTGATQSIYFSSDPQSDYTSGKFAKQVEKDTVIAGCDGFITRPKSNSGITGISVFPPNGKEKFVLFGHDLSQKTMREFKDIVSSIKYDHNEVKEEE